MVTVAVPQLLTRAPQGSSAADAAKRSRYIDGCIEFAACGLTGYMASVRP
jgi:hypothetical protein